MTIYILTSEYNDYDQHGEYFIEAFSNVPQIEQLQKHIDYKLNKDDYNHIINGGGRRESYKDYHNWYYFRIKEL